MSPTRPTVKSNVIRNNEAVMCREPAVAWCVFTDRDDGRYYACEKHIPPAGAIIRRDIPALVGDVGQGMP